jgi:hypothetical protein
MTSKGVTDAFFMSINAAIVVYAAITLEGKEQFLIVFIALLVALVNAVGFGKELK